MKICADVGGSFIDIAIIGDDAIVNHRHKHPTPLHDWDGFVAVFAEMQARHGHMLSPDAPISLSLAGLFDRKTGIAASANIPCIHGRQLIHELEAALGRPVRITNDADCFVLAETRLGAARGHEDVFGIVLGTGVGGGLLLRGQLMTGRSGVSGEWGHGPIVTRSHSHPSATPYFPCGCGQSGCLDTIGGARGIERLHAYLHGEAPGSREITDRWEKGDASAGETMDFYMEILSGALAAILNTLPVTIVPVGGGLSNSPKLVQTLDRQVRERMLRAPASPILATTTLGGDAGLLGAMLAARESISSPTRRKSAAMTA